MNCCNFKANLALSNIRVLIRIGIIYLFFSQSLLSNANESHADYSPDSIATEPVSTVGQHAHKALGWLDWVVIACYVGGVLTLGWYYSRKQSSTGEYFVGSMHMPPWLIGISIYATLLSTISYLAQPGEVIKHGPSFILGALVSIVISYFIVGYGLIPLIMKQRVTSAYELLEGRFRAERKTFGRIYVYRASVGLDVASHLPRDKRAPRDHEPGFRMATFIGNGYWSRRDHLHLFGWVYVPSSSPIVPNSRSCSWVL